MLGYLAQRTNPQPLTDGHTWEKDERPQDFEATEVPNVTLNGSPTLTRQSKMAILHTDVNHEMLKRILLKHDDIRYFRS